MRDQISPAVSSINTLQLRQDEQDPFETAPGNVETRCGKVKKAR
jgi:hypothetical protein